MKANHIYGDDDEYVPAEYIGGKENSTHMVRAYMMEDAGLGQLVEIETDDGYGHGNVVLLTAKQAVELVGQILNAAVLVDPACLGPVNEDMAVAKAWLAIGSLLGALAKGELEQHTDWSDIEMAAEIAREAAHMLSRLKPPAGTPAPTTPWAAGQSDEGWRVLDCEGAPVAKMCGGEDDEEIAALIALAVNQHRR